MGSDFQIFWTDEALRNLESILLYLEENWSQREIDNFKKQLGRKIKLIENNPKLFPVSAYNPSFRKAVLSKHTILFYKIENPNIYLVYLFNTPQNLNRIK